MMFIDHYGSLLQQQINSLGLNMSVVWLASELQYFVNGRGDQPFLLLNWEPNTKPTAEQLTRISIPPCRCGLKSGFDCVIVSEKIHFPLVGLILL